MSETLSILAIIFIGIAIVEIGFYMSIVMPIVFLCLAVVAIAGNSILEGRK